jgi:hypothetical protein
MKYITVKELVKYCEDHGVSCATCAYRPDAQCLALSHVVGLDVMIDEANSKFFCKNWIPNGHYGQEED